MKNLKFIFENARGYLGAILVVMVSTVMGTLAELVDPLILRYCMNEMTKEKLVISLLIFSSSIIVSLISAYLLNTRGEKAGEAIRIRVQEKLFVHFMHKDFKDIDDFNSGYMEHMVESDCHMVYEFCRRMPKWIMQLIASIIGAFVVFGSMSIKLTIMVIPMLIIMVAFEIFAPKVLLEKPYEEMREKRKEMVKYRNDRFKGIKDVVAFNMQDREFDTCHSLNTTFLQKSKVKARGRIRYLNGISGMCNILYMSVIAIGGYLVLSGELQPVDLIVYYSNLWMLTKPVLSISDFIDLLTEANISINKIREELDCEPSIHNADETQTPEVKGQITLNNVTFAYNDDSKVLSNLSVKINAGEFVALVGPSGSGKSTIANLIPRFYDTDGGVVSIDGVDVRDIELGYLRNNIGMVRQETHLFNGNVYENIAYTKPGASMDEVIAAAKAANAYNFIMKLPDGFQTDIGENGVKLSGGQRQRIAIARLFLKNPSICIFDEATSALDNHSEKVVQRAMDSLAQNRTTIVVAHRLDTIRNADRILYLDEGGIQEQGTHDELMAQKGLYYDLYNIEANDAS